MSAVLHSCIRVALCLASLPGTFALAFSSTDCTVTRTFRTRVALTNTPIVVNATIKNTGTNILRGLYYVDQVPSALAVSTVRVLFGRVALTNVVLESGYDSDVYPGCTPWRWRFESPTNFVEGNALLPGGIALIQYALNSSSTGVFSLQQFQWVASAPDKTNVSFGFNELLEERTVKFVASTNAPLLVGKLSSSGYTMTLDGMPRWPYVVSSSTNLHDWSPLVTNVSPFLYLDAPTPGRFYSANVYDVPLADLVLRPFSTNGWSVSVGGVSGCYYILQQSADLLNWSPVTTNLSPFSYLYTNSAPASTYYRATIALEP